MQNIDLDLNIDVDVDDFTMKSADSVEPQVQSTYRVVLKKIKSIDWTAKRISFVYAWTTTVAFGSGFVISDSRNYSHGFAVFGLFASVSLSLLTSSVLYRKD